MFGSKEFPLVSVIMNCYNGEKYLDQAIESLYSQTYKNWELIFWDNQSTDSSSQIIRKFDSRIKYYYAPKHTSLGEARNLALKEVRGKYISFLDTDDIWKPQKLELQVEQLERNPSYVLSYSGVQEIDENGNFIRNYLPEIESGFILKELLMDFNIHIIAATLRSSFLKKSNLNFDPLMTASEEYCLFIQLATIFPIGVITEPLSEYRVTINSLTTEKQNNHGFERRYSLRKVESLLQTPNKEILKAIKLAEARSYYYDARYYMGVKDRKKAILNMLKTRFRESRYVLLFMLTFLPFDFWKKVHVHFKSRS